MKTNKCNPGGDVHIVSRPHCIRRDARLWSPVVVKDGCDPSASFIPPCDSDGAGAACTVRQLRFASLFSPLSSNGIGWLLRDYTTYAQTECIPNVCAFVQKCGVLYTKNVRAGWRHHRLSAPIVLVAELPFFSFPFLEFWIGVGGIHAGTFCWDNSFLWLMHSGKSNG